MCLNVTLNVYMFFGNRVCFLDYCYTTTVLLTSKLFLLTLAVVNKEPAADTSYVKQSSFAMHDFRIIHEYT